MSLIAMFCDLDKSYVVSEVNNSEELRENFGLRSKLDYNQLCEFLAHFNELEILEFVLK